jgi:hypothetical protein
MVWEAIEGRGFRKGYEARDIEIVESAEAWRDAYDMGREVR